MAPRTRSKDAAAPVKEIKVVEKTTAKGKRKAVEEISTSSPKLQKKTTKVTLEEKPATNGKKSKKVKVVEEVAAETTEEGANGAEVDDGEDIKALVANFDSDDDEDPPAAGELFKPGQDVGLVPEASKALIKAAKPTENEETGIVYVGRIPHGFYEYEMRKFFSQFGPIANLRLSRNKKTGASKGYAFIEFEEETTAEVVAKTMDNYLLFGHILKCKMVPKAQVHDDLFKGANRRFKKVPWNRLAGKELEKPRTESDWKNKVSKEQAKRDKKAAQLQAMGYEYEAPTLKEVPAGTPTAIKEAADKPEAVEKVEEVKAIEVVPEPEEVTVEVVEEVEAPKSISAVKTKVTKAKAANKGRKAKK